MRRVLFLSAALLASATGAASAACTAETRVASGLQSLLQGNRVMTSQDHEHHGAGGVLTECARGAASTVDPAHVVGTWQVVPGGDGDVIQYDYGPGNHKFTFSVHSNGGANYSFCHFPAGGEAATGNLIAGSCP